MMLMGLGRLLKKYVVCLLAFDNPSSDNIVS